MLVKYAHIYPEREVISLSKLDNFANVVQSQFEGCRKIDKTFYFDESNNIKKGIIGEEKDNVDDLGHLCFVLGGIAIDGRIDFDELLNYVGARQAPSDAKFKFFSYGQSDFGEAIKQSRLRRFFEYLLDKRILIHFDVLHYMHFAMIDILDSLIEENDANQQAAFAYYLELQSDMTEVLYKDYHGLHSLLCSYAFPNVPKDMANSFINDVLDVYTRNLSYFDENNPKNFTKELLRQIIKAKRAKTNLLFLEDNHPFEISESVFQNYLFRMVEIKDKKHFDNEASITRQLRAMDADYETKLDVSFLDSKASREIQVCDVICGFVGRLYAFLGRNDEGEISKWVSGLPADSNGYGTVKAFLDLMTLSDSAYSMMFKKTVPLFIERRFSLFDSLFSQR